MSEFEPVGWRRHEYEFGPMEFEEGLDTPVNNVHYPGGVLPGPVHLLLDDRVSEAIESIFQDYKLQGDPEDFIMKVTEKDGKVVILKNNYPVEDYLDLLKSEFKRIELVHKTSQTENPEPSQESENHN